MIEKHFRGNRLSNGSARIGSDQIHKNFASGRAPQHGKVIHELLDPGGIETARLTVPHQIEQCLLHNGTRGRILEYAVQATHGYTACKALNDGSSFNATPSNVASARAYSKSRVIG